MPDDGPRHFELENALEDSDDCAKQPAQLAVLAPAAGSTRRRPLGSISRDSLLWTAHELAAQRHGRLRWSTSPPGEYRRAPLFNPFIEGDKGKKNDAVSQLSVVVPSRADGPERSPQKSCDAASPLSN